MEIQVTESSKSATFASPRKRALFLSLTPRKEITKVKLTPHGNCFQINLKENPFHSKSADRSMLKCAVRLQKADQNIKITQLVLSKSLNTLRETKVERTPDHAIFIQEKILLLEILGDILSGWCDKW